MKSVAGCAILYPVILCVFSRRCGGRAHDAAGISTNILAKMGKDKPVAMDSLAKICVALDCTLDDIVEINGGAEKDGD